MPRTKIKYVSSFSLILLMKGSKVISILLLTILGGGTIIETLDLSGLFRMFFHFFTSGNWSFNILIVFLVAVAVIISSLPPRPLNSPVDNAMEGRNAGAEPLERPQLTTERMWLQSHLK